jgi:hypothetical protein
MPGSTSSHDDRTGGDRRHRRHRQPKAGAMCVRIDSITCALYSTPSVLHSQKERIGFGDHPGSNRPLIITSGTGMDSRGPGELAVEQVFDRDNPNPRRLCEVAGVDAAQRGVSVPVVRLPQVHDTKRQGLISPVILIARQKGMSAYVGAFAAGRCADGLTRMRPNGSAPIRACGWGRDI